MAIKLPENYVVHEGAVYRKEARNASKKGDTIFIVEDFAYGKVGEIKTVKSEVAANYGVVTETGLTRHSRYVVIVPTDTVTVDGVDYVKSDESANVGDIIRVTDEDAKDHRLTYNGFYTVTRIDSWDDPQIIDEDGDDFDLGGWTYEVYALKAKSREFYTEIKRKANVGDRIRIVNADSAQSGSVTYKNGDEMVVERVGGVGFPNCGKYGSVFHYEYVVLEPLDNEKADRLKVGDYAKVINATPSFSSVGQIVKVTEDDRNDIPFNTVGLEGNYTGWHMAADLVRATDAEVAEAKRRAAVANVKVGDYVRITESQSNWPVGTTVKVTQMLGGCTIRVTDGKKSYLSDFYEPLTPAEAESYRKQAEWDEKRSTFAVGDKVRLLSGGEEYPLYGFKNGEVYEITSVDFDHHKYHPLKAIQLKNGGIYPHGYTAPDQIEKVSAEEVAREAESAKWTAIGRKVGEFRKGDVISAKTTEGGDICGIIEHIGCTLYGIRVPERGYRAANKEGAILIAPVESRFDAKG
jgi:YD repeat-containing protein